MTIPLTIPSPVEMVHHPIVSAGNVNLYVKREDKIHPLISGNKWRKLKYNIDHYQKGNHRCIVTFGGAFSNHIHACAAACHMYKIPCHGFIRGEDDIHNPTLNAARNMGMHLHFVSRSDYRDKDKNPNIKSTIASLDSPLVIPEGGSNDQALLGLQELAEEINQTESTFIAVSAGTGCTAAGILKHLVPSKKLLVFSSLKGNFLKNEILNIAGHHKTDQLIFLDQYHYGGYGKTPQRLIHNINDVCRQIQIPLDPIYNGKLFSGLLDQITKQQFESNSNILWIHTGGLQGLEAYNYIAQKKEKPLLDRSLILI